MQSRSILKIVFLCVSLVRGQDQGADRPLSLSTAATLTDCEAVSLAERPGDDRFYIACADGVIKIALAGEPESIFLDIRNRVGVNLGIHHLTFSPAGERVFVAYGIADSNAAAMRRLHKIGQISV